MKVCVFTNTYLPHVGGVARSVATFSQDLMDDGHQVLIIAPTFPGSRDHGPSEPGLLRVPAIQQFNGSDFSVRLPSPFLLETIEDFQPDIVHSNHPYLLGDTALRAARRNNLPLVFTHHTLYEEYSHYISKKSKNTKRLAAFLSTNYANMCDQVVAPSRSIKRLLRQRGVNVPVSVIPTGVDMSFFSNGDGKSFRHKHGIADDTVVLGHLGRLAPEKNLDYLAAAVAAAMKKTSNCIFLVVGDGPSAKNIRDTFAEAGLLNRLNMPGKISGQALADVYQAMNLFVFASKTETQGIVLTEALTAGVPVVALDAPGVREVVEDGKNGRLLDGESSADQFAQALAQTLASRRQMDQWSASARQTVSAFSRHRSTRKLLSLYADAIYSRLENEDYKTGDLDSWDKFLLICRTEWDLVAEKTESLIQAVDETKRVIGLDESH